MEKINELEKDYYELYKSFSKLWKSESDENKRLNTELQEIRDALKEAMIFIIKTEKDDIDMNSLERISSLKNYINNLYAFIFDHGLYKELTSYHHSIDMLAPGGHGRVMAFFISHLPCGDASQN